jgi:hypothetical protein
LPTSICVGGTSKLTTTGTATTYVWNHDLAATATNNVSPSLTTTYTVTGTDAIGCTNSKSIDVPVNIVTQPILATGSTGTGDVVTLMCKGTSQTIHVTNPGTNLVTWYNGNNTVLATDVATYTFKISKDTTIKAQYQDHTTKCYSDYTAVAIDMLKSAFTMADSVVNVGGTIAMTNTSLHATSYFWYRTGGVNDPQTFTTVNPVFNFNNEGTRYIYLVAQSSACKDTSYRKVTVKKGSGIEDLETSNMMIYPNPFKDIVSVELTNENKDVVITVYNLTGVKVLDKVYKNANEIKTIDMAQLPEGIYLMVLRVGNNSYTIKLKKE